MKEKVFLLKHSVIIDFNNVCVDYTGCPEVTKIFQEPLIGTSNAQLLMTNDSFSSLTWAILYLNETLIKSQNRTQPNDSPVRCQNQENFKTHMNLP